VVIAAVQPATIPHNTAACGTESTVGQSERGNLILIREPGESVQIGEDVTVEIVEVTRQGRVKIGIRAPRGLQILRDDAKATASKNG
jgi:carbon storage regulator CsrA